jgi:ABC-2 type transport system permease protein
VRATWIIAMKDLRLRLRDQSLWVIGLVAPLGLAFIFNLVFGGGLNDVGENITLDLGVVDEDPGEVSDAFLDVMGAVESDGLVELTSYGSVDEARTAVDDGDVGAVFLLGESLSEDLRSGADTAIEVVGSVDAQTTTQVAASIAERFAIGLQQANASAVTALVAGVIGPDEVAPTAQEAGAEPALIGVRVSEAATRQLDSATYLTAGMAIFFTFFIAGTSMTSMLDERREGTMARLLGAPISRGSVLAGKSLTSVMIAIVSLTVLMVASVFLMGADWGDPVGAAILVLTGVLAVSAVMTMVSGFATTAEQAANLQSIVAVTLAMLGGTFVPISSGDSLLGRLSLATPNAWFIRGLSDMAGGGWSEALPAAGVLLGMALVFGTIGLAIARKGVRV